MQSIPFDIQANRFWLSPNKTVFWEQEKILILSDLHLGKAAHFRKSGIAIPQQMFKEDMHRLLHEIQHNKPKRILIVGDLFHSIENKENAFFLKWRKDFSEIPITLVQGNHDILSAAWYTKAGIEIEEGKYTHNSFSFQHDYFIEDPVEGAFTFTGHLHPGIQIKGIARQSLTFPCFYFTPNHCILPAFGCFTGLVKIKPKKKDTVFAVIEKSIVKM